MFPELIDAELETTCAAFRGFFALAGKSPAG
jgi:hypothetical protein